MIENLKTLAIEVVQSVDRQSLLEMEKQAQEAAEKKMWMIILIGSLVIELALALLLPKAKKKFEAQKAEKERIKAERKRIQSKRKKEY